MAAKSCNSIKIYTPARSTSQRQRVLALDAYSLFIHCHPNFGMYHRCFHFPSLDINTDPKIWLAERFPQWWHSTRLLSLKFQDLFFLLSPCQLLKQAGLPRSSTAVTGTRHGHRSGYWGFAPDVAWMAKQSTNVWPLWKFIISPLFWRLVLLLPWALSRGWKTSIKRSIGQAGGAGGRTKENKGTNRVPLVCYSMLFAGL